MRQPRERAHPSLDDPTIWSDAATPSSAGPHGSASAGQPSALNGYVKRIVSGADLEVVDGELRRDERERGREQEVEAVHRRVGSFA